MCLYPKLIKNRKYTVTKKNGGVIPECKDPRTQWVPIGCQKCIECKKQKSRQWQVRLQEEIRHDKKGNFVSLTFSNEAIHELIKDIEHVDKETGEITTPEGYELDNEIATLATRRFLERWRKKFGKSVKHWLITELGHNGTENIHLHGIIFHERTERINNKRFDFTKADIKEIWGYGHVHVGEWVNEQTINYCSKYMTKMDFIHKEYNAKILTSPGIGNGYTTRKDAKQNKYNGKDTRETYSTRQGIKLNLPIYYRNKLYTEEEREKLWIQKLDENVRWVCGIKINMNKGPDEYYKVLEYYRTVNRRLGYGSDEKNWNRLQYENARRRLQVNKRIKKIKEMWEDDFE